MFLPTYLTTSASALAGYICVKSSADVLSPCPAQQGLLCCRVTVFLPTYLTASAPASTGYICVTSPMDVLSPCPAQQGARSYQVTVGQPGGNSVEPRPVSQNPSLFHHKGSRGGGGSDKPEKPNPSPSPTAAAVPCRSASHVFWMPGGSSASSTFTLSLWCP